MTARRIRDYTRKLTDALATLELPENFAFHVDGAPGLDPTVHLTRQYTAEGTPATRYSSVWLRMNATDSAPLDRPRVVLEFAVNEFNAEANYSKYTAAARAEAALSRDLLTAAMDRQ
jgi:hypothetical protein